MNLIYITGKIVSDIVKNITNTLKVPALNFRMCYFSGDKQCFITVNAYGKVAGEFDYSRGDILLVRGKLTDDKKYNVGIKAYEFKRVS